MRFSKKVCLGIVVGMMATGTALANPFDDVPRDHWAYDAVQTLAKDGVIDGYGDNTFRGDKPITRYEMAQLVGRAVSRERLGTAEDKALIEKLSKEYADELNSMGIRFAAVEKKTAGVSDLKISHWFQTENTYGDTTAPSDDRAHEYELEYRLTAEKQISPKLSAQLQLECMSYWDNDGWRQQRKDDGVYMRQGFIKYAPDEKTTFLGGKSAYWLAGGALGDDYVSGIYASRKVGANTTVQGLFGYYNGSQYAKDRGQRIFYTGVDTKAGLVDLGAHYISTNKNLVNDKTSNVWALTAGVPLGKSGVTLSGAYGKNTKADSDGALTKVQLASKLGKTDAFLQYWKQGANLDLPMENGNHLTWWGDEYNNDGHKGYRLILGQPISANCYGELWYGTYKNLRSDESGHKFGWAMTFSY